MKHFLPIVIAGLLLAGCSSAYRTGQTPDDVYYSSSPVVPAELTKRSGGNDEYQSYWANPDDDYLRMKVRQGGRWNTIDDLDYWYGYNGNCQCNSNWSIYNGYNRFNNFYNPWGYNSLTFSYGYNPWGWNNMFYGGGYYSGSYFPTYYYPVVVSKYPTAYSNPSRPNLRGYGNTLYGGNTNGTRRNRVSTSGDYRSIFGGNNSNSRQSSGSYDRPTRTFEPSSSPSSSGSSRSSGSGGSSSGSSSGSSRGGRGG